MKTITEKVWNSGSNAWGQSSGSYWQTFEIEESDVGTTRANFLGHGRPGKTFHRGDVGRHITVYTDKSPIWNCWGWSS